MMIRTFLPVGQGAFYHECFKAGADGAHINVVYDCGSGTDESIVNREIDSNFEQGEVVHALFISHLHKDHMNGIPHLLRRCKVKKIYFPLITSGDKKLLKIYNEIKGTGDFSSDFLDDPYEAVQEQNPLISPTVIAVREAGDQRPDDTDIEHTESGNDVFETVLRGENVRGEIPMLYRDWKYIPFNFRQKSRMRKLMDELSVQFGRTVTEDEVERMWRGGDPDDKDRIEEAYKKVPGSFNTNSMALFSGTDRHGYRQYMGMPHKYCKFCHISAKEPGCLYMGDYDASGGAKWNDLKTAYQKYWPYIGCVQVPHHGSSYNFNDQLLHIDAFFVISAGYKNKYRHPHGRVLREFLFRGICPYIVTEHTGSSVRFLIDP